MVVTGTKLDEDLFEVVELDATRDAASADDGIAAHAEAREAVGRQRRNVVGRAVAVEDVERVDLVGFVNTFVRVERGDGVLDASWWCAIWPWIVEDHRRARCRRLQFFTIGTDECGKLGGEVFDACRIVDCERLSQSTASKRDAPGARDVSARRGFEEPSASSPLCVGDLGLDWRARDCGVAADRQVGSGAGLGGRDRHRGGEALGLIEVCDDDPGIAEQADCDPGQVAAIAVGVDRLHELQGDPSNRLVADFDVDAIADGRAIVERDRPAFWHCSGVIRIDASCLAGELDRNVAPLDIRRRKGCRGRGFDGVVDGRAPEGHDGTGRCGERGDVERIGRAEHRHDVGRNALAGDVELGLFTRDRIEERDDEVEVVHPGIEARTFARCQVDVVGEDIDEDGVIYIEAFGARCDVVGFAHEAFGEQEVGLVWQAEWIVQEAFALFG